MALVISPFQDRPVGSFTKHEELEDLRALLAQSVAARRNLESDLAAFRDSARSSRQCNALLEAEVQQLRRLQGASTSGCSPFVLVLVDGDHSLFHDRYVQAGERGGRDAAHALHQALEGSHGEIHDIVIRVFINSVGLEKTYEDRDTRASVVRDFIAGFNKQFPLVEFVDAGQDKEAADNKIKGNLDHFWKIKSCEHIVLACSGDDGYVNHLHRYTGRSENIARLTLIKTLPFNRGFRGLVRDNSFQTLELPQIFRSKALNTGAARDRVTPIQGQYVPAVGLRDSSVSSSSSSSSASAQHGIVRNQHGQRIDQPLQPYNKALIKPLEARHLCHSFHLRGDCPFGRCSHVHGSSLSKAQKAALRYIARNSCCHNGTNCADPACVAGHHCPEEENGRCLRRSKCRFTAEMHNFDMVPVDSN